MKRAWIVSGATALGLVGVLAFHTTPARLNLGGLSAPSVSETVPSGGGTGGSAPPKAASAPLPTGSQAKGTAGSTPTPTTAATSSPRTATGAPVNYSWGVLSVAVTKVGNTITRVGIASLDDGGNPRSLSIDQQSIPVLEQQTMAAQSADIQGVSGASYTSSGFKQSLQSALGKLNS